MMVLERVRAKMTKIGSRGAIFAIETGGHYRRNLAYFLDEVGIPFRSSTPTLCEAATHHI